MSETKLKAEGKIEILIVDDDIPYLEIVKHCLEKADCSLSVDTFSTPLDAITALQGKPYGCIVSDYTMPGMNGLELCAKIRTMGYSTPFILFTCHGSEEIAEKAFNVGVDIYLRKEKNLAVYSVLARNITSLVKKHRAEEALAVANLKMNEVLERIQDGLFTLDGNWLITYVNTLAANYVGFRSEELVGQNLWEKLPRFLGAEHEVNYREAMEKKEPRRFIVPKGRMEGGYDISVYPTVDGVSIFWSEVTDPIKAEEELLRRKELRKTGIELIGDVPWGTHFCQFYQTKEDMIDILVPYFKAGFENNEFCMWVTAKPLDEADALQAMEKALPNFSKYLEQGQMEILSYKDWYLKDGSFDSDRVLNGWISKLETALKRGYSGLRLNGNTFWLERNGWKEFTDYEEMINNVIGKYRMIAVCTYSLDRCNANEIIDVVKNHQFALIKRYGNWELIESSDRKKIEKALRVSEERYSALFSKMTDGFAYHKMIYDEEGEPIDYVFLEVNDAFERQTGLRKQEIIGKNVKEVLPGIESDPANWLGVYGRVASTGEEARFENYSDSLGRWYSVYAYSPERGNFAAIFRDITERKKSEQMLRESESKMRKTQEMAHLGSWELNLLDNKLSWSDEVYNIFGLQTHEFEATYEAFLDAVHPEDREAVDAAYTNSIHEGVDSYEIEHRVVRRSTGEMRIVHEKCEHIRDESGRIIRSIGMVHDITDRKRMEEELAYMNEKLRDINEKLSAANEELQISNEDLAASNEELAAQGEELRAQAEELHNANLRNEEYAARLEEMVQERTERLRAFMESVLSDPFVIWDHNLNLLEANTAFLGWFQPGTRMKDLIGKNIREIARGAENRERYPLFLQVIETGKPIFIHNAPSLTGYGDRIYDVKAFKLREGIGVINYDITERKLMEERLREAQQNNVMERLSAMVAHDIRNPLNTANQALEMARKNPGKSDQMLDLAGQSLSRAIDMIEGLRESSRFIEPKRVSVDIRSLVEETVNGMAQHEGVKYDLTFDNDIHDIWLDPALIRRVMENLLSNAIEAMPGGGSLKVSVNKHGDDLLISVTDTGIGIPEDAAENIFKPLYTTKSKGVGLGLSFCRRAVEAHGGTIGFKSNVGEGTTFTIRLPMA